MAELLTELFYYEKGITKYDADIFDKIWNYDHKKLIYVIFYLRKNRKYGESEEIEFNGRGQKRIFWDFLIWMSNNKLTYLIKILPHVPDYGYWKDLLVLMDTPAESLVIKLFADQLIKDYTSYRSIPQGLISLASKWTPNERSSYDIKYRTFGKIARSMGITNKTLRKEYLVPLRKYLNITEQLITDKQWKDIDYNRVPRLCMEKFRNVFLLNDHERFTNFEKNKPKYLGKNIRLPKSVNLAISKKSPISNISYETFIKQENTLIAIDISKSMVNLESMLAISLCSEMAGVQSWLPYNIYGGDGNKIISYNLNKKNYLHRYVDIKNVIDKIHHGDDICGMNIEECVRCAYSMGKRNLIILSNMSVDISEISKFSGNDLNLTYWCISDENVVIEESSDGKNTTCIIEGYNGEIYEKIVECRQVTKKSYMKIILKELLKEPII